MIRAKNEDPDFACKRIHDIRLISLKLFYLYIALKEKLLSCWGCNYGYKGFNC
jgi:hypothetical protein